MRFRKSQVGAYSTLPGHGMTYLPGKIAGALLLVSQIEDAVPLIHGPVGCSFQRKLNPYRPYSLFYETPCTNMDDVNAVYGGEEALEEAIVETYERYRPRLIVVITTCASDLIGDDVKAVVERAKRTVRCDVIYSTGNFVGRAKPVGYQDVFYAIVDQLLDEDRKAERIESSVNLITLALHGAGMKTAEMASVLERMGIKINKIYFDHTKVEDLYELPKAELNIVDYPQVWTRVAKRKWGVDCYELRASHLYKDPEKLDPFGIEGSTRVFREIAERLGKDEEGEKVIRKLKNEAQEKLYELRKDIEGRRIAVEGGLSHGIGLMAIRELGMKVSALIYRTHGLEHHGYSEEALKEKFSLDVEVARKYGSVPLVLVNPSAEEEIRALKETGTELVICRAGSAPRYEAEGFKTFNSTNFALHHLRVGFECPLELCRKMKEALEKPPRKASLLGLLEYDLLYPWLTPSWAKLKDIFGVTREGAKGEEVLVAALEEVSCESL